MNIDSVIKDLGAIEIDPLSKAILSQSADAWHEQNHRQTEFEVHYQTESIVMLFCTQSWPEITVSKEPGWTRIADAALPIMEKILREHYPQDGTVIRAMAAKLPAGKRILPHFDAHKSFKFSHRIHLPITTNKSVRFNIAGKPQEMKVGHAYEINNQLNHSVLNAGKEDRINFIFDFMPADVAAQQNVTIKND